MKRLVALLFLPSISFAGIHIMQGDYIDASSITVTYGVITSTVQFTAPPLLNKACLGTDVEGNVQEGSCGGYEMQPTTATIDISSGVLLSGAAGVPGQFLMSAGADTVPTWQSISTGGGGYEMQPTTATIDISSGVLLSGAAGDPGQFMMSGGDGSVPTWQTVTASGGGYALEPSTVVVRLDPGMRTSSGTFTSSATIMGTGGLTVTYGISASTGIYTSGVQMSSLTVTGDKIKINTLQYTYPSDYPASLSCQKVDDSGNVEFSACGGVDYGADINALKISTGNIALSTGTLSVSTAAIAVSTGLIAGVQFTMGQSTQALAISTGSLYTLASAKTGLSTFTATIPLIYNNATGVFDIQKVSLSTGVTGTLPSGSMVSTTAFTISTQTFSGANTFSSSNTFQNYSIHQGSTSFTGAVLISTTINLGAMGTYGSAGQMLTSNANNTPYWSNVNSSVLPSTVAYITSTQAFTGAPTFVSSSTFQGAVYVSTSISLGGTVGNSGQFLKSVGAGAAVAWGDAAYISASVQPATVTFQLDKGMTATTGTYTSSLTVIGQILAPQVPQYKMQLASQTMIAATNITDLVYAMSANTTYYFDCMIVFKTTATTLGMGLAVTVPSGNIFYTAQIPFAAAGAGGEWGGSGTASAAFITSTAILAAETYYVARLFGISQCAATPGNLQIQAKGEVATSQVTIFGGSICSFLNNPRSN